MEERETGTVHWFNDQRGYGFITQDAGGEIFVHCSGIRGSGRRLLSQGQRVEFVIRPGPKGPQAEDVIAIPAARNGLLATVVRSTGTVKWFSQDENYGFITCDSGEDVFVHRGDVLSITDPTLAAGQRVEFTIRLRRKGPRATDVVILE